MAQPSTEPLYPPLTARLVRRSVFAGFAEPAARIERQRKRRAGNELRFFALSWAGGFVFFLSFIG